MKKKLVVALGLLLSLSFLAGCGDQNLIDQGKEAIEQGNYEEATAIFKAAIEEDSKEKVEAEGLYDLTYNYVIATKAYDEFKLDIALDSLSKVEENKNSELIKDDVSKLNQEISKDKDALETFRLNMEKVNSLESKGEISKARELLNNSLENVAYLGDNAQELIDNGTSKLKDLDKKIEKIDQNKKIESEKSNEEKAMREKALETVKNLGVVKKDQYLELKSNEIYDLGNGSLGFIINKYYSPDGKPDPAFICQYLIDKDTWKVKEVKDGITKELN